MIYLSKGIATQRQNEGNVTVSHCGALHKLTDQQAALWLSGRYSPAHTQTVNQDASLKHLLKLGIVETADGSDMTAIYRLLINCVICPRTSVLSLPPPDRLERRVWRWIKEAGLRLTIAELVFLVDKAIAPIPELLGEANRQALTETIYMAETIGDGILESTMENAPARDTTVEAVLGLLCKRKIFLI